MFKMTQTFYKNQKDSTVIQVIIIDDLQCFAACVGTPIYQVHNVLYIGELIILKEPLINLNITQRDLKRAAERRRL